MAKRMVNDAEEVNKLTDYVRQEGNKTIIGGNLAVDGNLTVNGTAPGGASLHVYKVKGSGGTFGEITFLWTCSTDNMTVSSMISELSYMLSSGSGFGMGIPACAESSGSYDTVIVADGGSTVYRGSQSASLTINTVYKIY